MAETTTTKKFSTPMDNKVPFYTTVDMDSTASTNGGAKWCTLPAYGVDYIIVEITVATNNVTVTVTPDSTGGLVFPTQTYALTAGASAQKCIAVIGGVDAGTGLAYGSHTFVVTLTSTVGGAHGTCTGRVHLYGRRRT